MQLNEFIEATNTLENYYNKTLTTEQMQIMYDNLKQFSLERYKKLISKCLKTCKYMPKIADIISANMEIADVQEEEKKTVVECPKCNGSGLVQYTVYKQNGNTKMPYLYVARCNCENAKYVNQKIPCYEELGINIGNRLEQVKDATRSIEEINKIKSKMMKNFSM